MVFGVIYYKVCQPRCRGLTLVRICAGWGGAMQPFPEQGGTPLRGAAALVCLCFGPRPVGGSAPHTHPSWYIGDRIQMWQLCPHPLFTQHCTVGCTLGHAP
jgi:hypothetical protein